LADFEGVGGRGQGVGVGNAGVVEDMGDGRPRGDGEGSVGGDFEMGDFLGPADGFPMHEGAQGPEIINAGNGAEGTIVTTMMVLNASVLLEATGKKVRKFLDFVKVTEPKPNIIIVHEVNG